MVEEFHEPTRNLCEEFICTDINDYPRRDAILSEIAEKLTLELLENNKKEFQKYYELILSVENNRQLKYTAITTLEELMTEEFLREDREMYERGLDYLFWLSRCPGNRVPEKAKTVFTEKWEIYYSPKDNKSNSPPNLQ